MKLFSPDPQNTVRKFATGKTLLAIGLFSVLSGCATAGYYSQIVTGHFKIVLGKRPIAEVVADESVDPGLKHRLQLAQRAREYAIKILALPNNESYTSFYDTGQNNVTWNVVAAPEFSFDPQTWCFPVAGCVSYRGYYTELDARKYEKGLKDQGLDTAVNGATAYSTLGWFKDPLLNTMLERSDPSIAALLFHELAHQQLYVGDDSTFNESFATFVEQQGLRNWRENEKRVNPEAEDPAIVAEVERRAERQTQFVALLSSTREDLEAVYESGETPGVMRTLKAQRFAQLREEYDQLKESWGGYTGYDRWFSRDLNNARLVAVATYNDYIPAFEVLFKKSDNSFEKFYAASKELAQMPAEERTLVMETLLAEASQIVSK